MKKLLRNSLIASVVAVTGVVSGAGASFASSATLDLSGSVAPSCDFDQASYSNSAGSVLKTSGKNSDIRWTGNFNVACNHGGQVNITASVAESGQVATVRALPEYDEEYFRVSDGSTSQILWANGSTSATASPQPYNTGALSYTFYLDTDPSAGETGLPAGSYGYTITMTAAPN